MARGIALKCTYGVLAELAARAEQQGFQAVWVSEGAREPIVQAGVAVQATRRIDVGTNITLAFPRSPTVSAMQAWDLDELSGHRFVLGLGSQVRRIIEERFSSEFVHPARRMGEYLQAMRAVWDMERGELSTFDGEFYRVVRPGLTGLGDADDRPVPRTYLAAVGPLMTQVAARHADGLLGHPFTSQRYLTDTLLPRLDACLKAADRRRSDFKLCQGAIVSIADDRDVAIQEAKQQIGFYGTTPNYRAVFEAHGDESLTDQLRDVWKASKGSPGALAAAVPDEVVDRYAAAGTPDDVRDRIGDLEQHVDQVILGPAWYGVHPERQQETTTAIIETLGL